MKRVRYFLFALVFGICLALLIHPPKRYRNLGQSRIAGTPYSISLFQQSGLIGGSKPITMQLLSGNMLHQTQEILVFGENDRKKAAWDAPETIQPVSKDGLQRVSFTLTYPDGGKQPIDAVIGLAP